MILKESRTRQYKYEIVAYHEQHYPRQFQAKWRTVLGYARNKANAIAELKAMVEHGGAPITLVKYEVETGFMLKETIDGPAFWQQCRDQELAWIDKLQEEYRHDGICVSRWVRDEHCAFRFIIGTDPSLPENRVAFIEKTPRIRFIAANDEAVDWADHLRWESGPKGSGGADGHIPENEYYGFDPDSRLWCDDMLKKLGYVVEEGNDLVFCSASCKVNEPRS